MKKAKEEYYEWRQKMRPSSPALNYIKYMEELIKQVEIISNNTICLQDNSDFETALWKILSIVKPEIFEYTPCPELKLIEEPDDKYE